jgi:predicted DNA-binding protein with PD1-like motif
MTPLPLRLAPGDDVRRALEDAVAARGCRAAFVVCGIGSLSAAQLRFAGRPQPQALAGDLEILTLAGTIAAGGSHLHASLSDADGRVVGGHLAPGCIVRTTCELLVALLPDWDFAREPDPATGYAELVLRPREGGAGA